MFLDKIFSIADTVIDRLIPDKKLKAQFRSAFRLKFLEYTLQERELMQKFFLEYEGRAVDMPKFVQYARALIRPFFTWVLGIVGVGWVIGQAFGFVKQPMPAALKEWVSIVMVFWFGWRGFEKIKGKD